MTAERAAEPPSQPAHRPSRRNEIVQAATRQFARNGYADTAVGDVAADADVAVTAVYYHFSGKDELFGAAVRSVFEAVDSVVAAARADIEPGAPPSLHRVIDAVWEWIDHHPDEATLLYLQLPGATPQISALRSEFEHDHAESAFGYFADPSDPASAAPQAERTLAARTLVDVLISIHTMRLADGPLSDEPGDEMRSAVHDLATRLVES